MIDRLDLTALLADPARAAEVPVEQVPALFHALRAERSRLDAVEDALVARLVAGSNGHAKPDPQSPYTLSEAAVLLRKSSPWLRRKAKAGSVPGARKVGKSWVFARDAFDRYRHRPQVG